MAIAYNVILSTFIPTLIKYNYRSFQKTNKFPAQNFINTFHMFLEKGKPEIYFYQELLNPYRAIP